MAAVDVVVRRGQAVVTGTILGHTAGRLHFGVRAGEAYLDPAIVLGGPGSGVNSPDVGAGGKWSGCVCRW